MRDNKRWLFSMDKFGDDPQEQAGRSRPRCWVYVIMALRGFLSFLQKSSLHIWHEMVLLDHGHLSHWWRNFSPRGAGAGVGGQGHWSLIPNAFSRLALCFNTLPNMSSETKRYSSLWENNKNVKHPPTEKIWFPKKDIFVFMPWEMFPSHLPISLKLQEPEP